MTTGIKQVLIDGDVILYKAGFVCEKSSYFVGKQEFLYKREAKEYAEKVGKDVVKKREAFSENICYKILQEIVKTICETLECKNYLVIVGSKDKTFRHDIAVTAPYKGNRKSSDKPLLFDKARLYLLDNFKCVESTSGLETDDDLGILQNKNIENQKLYDKHKRIWDTIDPYDDTEYEKVKSEYRKYLISQGLSGDFQLVSCSECPLEGKDFFDFYDENITRRIYAPVESLTEEPNRTIIASIDKDLLMLPGRHYNINTKEVILSTDPGSLTLKRTKSNKLDLKGTGFKWFCAQMLLGDAVDNIIKPKKGLGPRKVYNLLNKLDTKESLWKEVSKHYTCKERQHENAQLLWILREEGKTYKEYLND